MKEVRTFNYLDEIEFPLIDVPLGYRKTNWHFKNGNELLIDYVLKDIDLYTEIEIECFNMPIILINTNDTSIDSNEEYTKSLITVYNSGNYDFTDISAGVRLRGNSTLTEDKKPYRIKFDKKQNLLGLNDGNKFKSWVLLADYYDYSLLRNWTSFNIAKNFDFYSSDCQNVELYINGEYKGVYLLCEQQQIDKNRINIEEYKEGVSDITNTGYLLEQDFSWRVEDPNIIVSIDGQDIGFEIKSDTVDELQIQFIKQYLVDAFGTLCDVNSTRDEISYYFDIENAVEMCLYLMIPLDGDPNASFYLCKDKNGKIMFTAPWDDDWAYGNDRGIADFNKIHINYLMSKFMKFDWFVDLLKSKWNEKKESIMGIVDKLKEYESNYIDSFNRNFIKWDLIGKKISYQTEIVLDFECYEDAFDYLINWLINRLNFLDSYYAGDTVSI